MIIRDLKEKVLERATYYPIVAILGPRQSGKTTLAQDAFNTYAYVSLENYETRGFAQKDPQGFLNSYANEQGIIIDEFQHVPELLSYIQTRVDAEKKMGHFILTGSQNFLMNMAISQSLAGRVSIITLLPLSLHELKKADLVPSSVNQLLVKGFYPPLYSRQVPPDVWYPDYRQTYIERDIRQLTQVADLGIFQTFMQLCAGRIGQLLNLTALAQDCGISDMTAKRWIHLLEASYILFLLRPHHNNFGKRLTKSPKLYFYDTGLACSLLNISPEQLPMHPFKGALFESMVIADLMKQYFNQGKRPSLYFWRDHTGNEIDCLIEHGTDLIPIEIKAGQTLSNDFFKGLSFYNQLAGNDPASGYLIYAGTEQQKRSLGSVLSWDTIDQLITPLS